jgi:hypothetical protein
MLLIERVLCYFGVSGASSGFGGMSLSSFCVKGWFFFVASPAMVVAAVGFRPSGSTRTDLVSPQTRYLLAHDACSTFKVHQLRVPDLTASSRFDAGSGVWWWIDFGFEHSPAVRSCGCYGKIQQLERCYM